MNFDHWLYRQRIRWELADKGAIVRFVGLTLCFAGLSAGAVLMLHTVGWL
jgi:hypothetical protein